MGSFNFDPRSARLNTELGFVIDSPTLAGRIAESFERDLPSAAYRVCLDGQGKLYWQEQRGGQTIRHDTEPGTTLWQRISVWFVSLLPLEPLL
ncbi:Cardiolipin synthase C [compost metagenome]